MPCTGASFLRKEPWVFGHCQVPLAPGSLVCVLSQGTAECEVEPWLLSCSLLLPGLQVGGSQNLHFREVCKEQLGWGVEEEEPGCSPARPSSAAVVTDDASPNVLWSCVTREAVLSPSVLELAFNLVWNERLVKMMNGAQTADLPQRQTHLTFTGPVRQIPQTQGLMERR